MQSRQAIIAAIRKQRAVTSPFSNAAVKKGNMPQAMAALCR
jgi:hypothetical protein